MATLYLIFLLSSSIWCVFGAKILVVFPMPSRSHYIIGSVYAKALVDAGHEVTMISPFSEKNSPKNYKEVVLTGFLEHQEEAMKDFNPFTTVMTNPLLIMFFMNSWGAELADETLSHPNVQQFLNSNETFDLVVVEQFIFNAVKGLVNHFNAPQILLSTVGPNAWVNEPVQNPSPPSYVPEIALGFPSNMTFFQRVKNTLFALTYTTLQRVLWYPEQNKVMKKYFPDNPDLSEINKNVSLVLLNSHISLNNPVPLVPNMVEIGGFHVKPPKKLPQDLQKYLDDAKEGVIYFSMGSNIKSKELPVEKREAILNTFRKLKVKVLWKWEDDVLPNQPENVKLGKWLPQQDILAHPNVKLFITHGGLLSSIETIYHGKPIIAIPIYGDQSANAKNAEMKGYGLTLPFSELTEQRMTAVINEMLNNPRYSENAKSRSRIMHDRQVKPLDAAVYWTEYVIRHKGAHHLRVAGVDLPLYQYLLLDVFAFIISVAVGSTILLIYIVKKVCSRRKRIVTNSKHIKKE